MGVDECDSVEPIAREERRHLVHDAQQPQRSWIFAMTRANTKAPIITANPIQPHHFELTWSPLPSLNIE